jgi:hypothetical protein
MTPKYVHRGMTAEPDWMGPLRRLRSWAAQPELCAACRRAPASVLRQNRPLCRPCAGPQGPLAERTRELQARTQALLGEIRQDEATRGAVGLAVPYGEIVEIEPGRYEVFERGAFEESVVGIKRGHRGDVLTTARAFSLPAGLYFEAADLAQRDIRGTIGASIEFDRNTVVHSIEPYQGGQLRRIKRAHLLAIALIAAPERPAYRTTWCSSKSPQAWQRCYGGTMALLSRAAGE